MAAISHRNRRLRHQRCDNEGRTKNSAMQVGATANLIRATARTLDARQIEVRWQMTRSANAAQRCLRWCLGVIIVLSVHNGTAFGRGADTASNGPYPSVGYPRGPMQADLKGSLKKGGLLFWRPDHDFVQGVMQDESERDGWVVALLASREVAYVGALNIEIERTLS